MADDCDIRKKLFFNYPDAQYGGECGEKTEQSKNLRKELMKIQDELAEMNQEADFFEFNVNPFLDCRLLYHSTCDGKSLDNLIRRKGGGGVLGFSTGRIAGETMIACIEPLRRLAREKVEMGEELTDEERSVLSEEGMAIFEFCGLWLDYQNPIHKEYIDRMHEKHGPDSMQKLAEKGVDAVDWWNSIGRSGEFHVITPEKSLRKVEFIPTKESGKRYVVERCQELLGEH